MPGSINPSSPRFWTQHVPCLLGMQACAPGFTQGRCFYSLQCAFEFCSPSFPQVTSKSSSDLYSLLPIFTFLFFFKPSSDWCPALQKLIPGWDQSLLKQGAISLSGQRAKYPCSHNFTEHLVSSMLWIPAGLQNWRKEITPRWGNTQICAPSLEYGNKLTET